MTARPRIPLLAWAAVSALALALLAVSASLGATVYGVPPVVSIVVALLHSAGLLLAVRFPVLGVAVAVVGAVSELNALAATGAAPWPVPVATTIGFAATLGIAALQGQWLISTAGGILTAGTALAVTLARGQRLAVGPVIADLIVFVALAGLAILIALFARSWIRNRERLAEAEEASELSLARRQVAEERTRIAREMHDVVAHGMSVIQVQAASARYRHPGISDEVASEFDELAATARLALGEMRTLLGVLRADGDAEEAPQPGLAELPELVSRSRAELLDRLPSEVRQSVDPFPALTVYRVVQESLGNVARHAPGADAVVELDLDPEADALIVRVRNTALPGRAVPTADPSGHGIRGMRERVVALGGVLTAEPSPDGGFAVAALVPLHPQSPEARTP
ncbi:MULTISPECIES: sensor histidine kinase [unclassified Leucobacter]|uniref:sensor histidine kinase n=1 Tax=unclassified Leucobacter TaxID=2621730 RepID=UPI000621B2FC|nr:histidine kinase [Leucobacter sp. Ag1]KKI18758.1 hypothetical protein XM48_10835 [Leucobacter sp. Ag1]